jgi:hypothetical protein
LLKVLQDPSRAEFHPAARRLIKLIHFRSHPGLRLRELETELLEPRLSESFPDDLQDFLRLLDADAMEADELSQSVGPALRQEYAQLPPSTGGDLAGWIRWFQISDTPDDAFRKWEDTKSLPWLVAAMVDASPDFAKIDALLAAAEEIPKGSSAYPTLAFHRIRLLVAMKEEAQAREALAGVAAFGSASFPRSSWNLFLQKRLGLARNLNEFLRDAPRELPEAEYLYQNNLTPGALFDEDAVGILDRSMPLDKLAEAVASRKLPPNLQAVVARATWARAILLERPEIARRVMPQFPTGRREAILHLLRYPGLTPRIRVGSTGMLTTEQLDQLRDTWWCSVDPWVQPPPSFLTKAQQARAASEVGRIPGPATGYLGQKVLEWAKASPTDPDIPEALHLVVRATRDSCSEAHSLSAAAFHLLHKRYPNSPWTKKTRYYY